MKTYEQGVALLVERLEAMHRSEWSPTPERKAAEAIAAKLDELADLLAEDGIAQASIQQFHDQPQQPQIGIDGRPEPLVKWVEGSPEPTVNHRDGYSRTIGHMRALAESARQVAAEMPNPRKKHALPFAALALLHLRYEHGYPRPTLYAAGDALLELQRIVKDAGIGPSGGRLPRALELVRKDFDPAARAEDIELSPTTLRNALSKAFKEFDPLLVPAEIDELIR